MRLKVHTKSEVESIRQKRASSTTSMWGSLELDQARAIAVDDTHGELAQVDDEALLELVDAPAQQIESFLERHVRSVVAVQRRHGKERTVAMRGEGHCGERSKVVDPVQRRFRTWQVKATEQQVDLVRVARA